METLKRDEELYIDEVIELYPEIFLSPSSDPFILDFDMGCLDDFSDEEYF